MNKYKYKNFKFVRFFLFLYILIIPLHTAASQSVDCRIASTAVHTASRLRGLDKLHAVPCKLQNKEEVEQYIRATLDTKIPPERIENEGWAYKMLGLIPKDFEYLDGIIQLYTAQLGGYYDTDKKHYVMASWLPEVMQMPIAVHELTHALQDQHYDLDSMINLKFDDSDALMARAALIEGDATAVMLDYARELRGQHSIAKEKSVSGIMVQNIAGAMFTTTMHSAPQSLQAILIFPYISGLNFAHALLREGGYHAIDKAYSRLPTSTKEILHPELYLSGKQVYSKVQDLLPPEHVRLKSNEPIFSDRLGEFITATFLGAWISPIQASKVAAGWAGDRLSLYIKEDSETRVLVWATLWGSNEEAKEFFMALSMAYKKRFNQEAVKEGDKVSFTDSDFGRIIINLEDKKVVLLIGVD
jgi:hypothetical protein